MRDALNVKEIAEAEPDFMGFIFYPGSPRYIGKEPDISLFRNIPPGITRIGVFVNEDINKITETANFAGLEMIQLHGNETVGYCNRLRSAGLKIIKVFNLGFFLDQEALKPYLPVCDYFLFDSKTDRPGGSGSKFKWIILKDYKLDKPFFLSGGIGPRDAGIIKTVENNSLFAIDINSKFESSAGLKNAGLVKTFIKEIKKRQI